MISICSVLLDKIDNYKTILTNSIANKTKLVKEVIFANNSKSPPYYKEWKTNNIIFREFGSQENFPQQDYGSQHGLGLNFAIDKASYDLVYLCDPDVFFYTAVDELYFNIKNNFSLQAVGASHHAAAQLSHTFFPWHGNVLLDKKDLPKANFLKDEIPEGKFLIAGAGVKNKDLYPYPEGNFDTASGLWLHAYLNNWKWLSFQTTDTHLYTTKYFRGNFKVKEKLKIEKLFYHAVSGAITVEAWEPFLNEYDLMCSSA